MLDSIRWVLGEQSAKALRGGEMKDVIFSGTDQRPPLGMAEVSLTFGECEEQLGTEYNEVTITRRVFRDGASEYELNKTPCRLRDIQHLFMDTGVGRSAYSIMEQGKIDLILSSRPEDRRAIFEEAAGITKFKSQKKEALRKLENTEANLVRLADIIREVKRQIGSLQRQAGKARRYQASFAELAVLEQKLGRHQFETYTGRSARCRRRSTARAKGRRGWRRRSRRRKRRSAPRAANWPRWKRNWCELRDEQAAQRHALERAQQRATTNQARVDEFSEPARAGRARDRRRRRKKSASARISSKHLNEEVTDAAEPPGTETQDKFDAEQEALASLTARISVVESECAEIEERRLEAERKQQKLGHELAGLELQQRNFQLRLETLKGEQTALRQRGEELNLVFTHFGSKVASGRVAAGGRSRYGAGPGAHVAPGSRGARCAPRKRIAPKCAEAPGPARPAARRWRNLQAQHANAPRAAQRLLAEEAAREIRTLAARITVRDGYESALALPARRRGARAAFAGRRRDARLARQGGGTRNLRLRPAPFRPARAAAFQRADPRRQLRHRPARRRRPAGRAA